MVGGPHLRAGPLVFGLWRRACRRCAYSALDFSRCVGINFAVHGNFFEIGRCPAHIFSYYSTVKLAGVALVPPGVVTVIGPLAAPSGTVAQT